MDRANLLEQLIALLDAHGIRYCVIGGVGVNAYTEPVITLDFDLVIATDQLQDAEKLLGQSFQVKRFAPSLNISALHSQLRVQIQTDSRYADFVTRAAPQRVLGLVMPIAQPQDILQGKIWAAQDPARRTSKYFKDLADIARLLEKFPELRPLVPDEILAVVDRRGRHG